MLEFCDKNKKLLIITFFSTLFVHLLKFVNYYPTPDSMYGIEKSIKGMIPFGRWFSGISANLTSSPFDLQWVGGVFSAVFISFTVILLLKIFDIQTPKYQYLCIATFVTFPCVTATFVYSLWSSAYMSALLCAVLAIYICINMNRSLICIVASTLLFAVSLGIYQIYYTFSLLIVLFYVFVKVLNGEEKTLEIRKVLLRFFVAYISGAVLYVIINKIVLAFCKTELSDYQGISGIHIPNIKEIFSAIKKSLISFKEFFSGSSISSFNEISILSFYLVINAIVFVLLGLCIYRYIVLKKEIFWIKRILMMVIILMIIPVGYAFYFVSTGVRYHRLMEFGNFFVYFLLLLFLQHISKIEKRFRQILVLSLILISAYNFFNANIAYHQMSISYEKTYFQNIEIASKIDDLSDEETKTVAVIGKMKKLGKNFNANPVITGASTDAFTISEPHVLYFANYYLGRKYIQCNQEKKEAILKSKEFSEMTDYPSKNSIKVIDDIIVVKLSDESYED